MSRQGYAVSLIYCSGSDVIAPIQRAYKSIRSLQMFILLFNIVNRDFIFTLKLLEIGISISSGYAAIAHFKDYPIFGVMYNVVFMGSSLLYMLIYGKGYKVSDTFKNAKTLLGSHVRRNGMAGGWKILEKQLLSIPPMGIKVGEFHVLERTSIPTFLHYVLTNIVNMLVAFG